MAHLSILAIVAQIAFSASDKRSLTLMESQNKEDIALIVQAHTL